MNELLLRRRNAIISSAPPLPYDAEVEYISTNGTTQYIDTLLTLTSDTTKISCEFRCKFGTISNSSKIYAISVPDSFLQVYTHKNYIYNQLAKVTFNTSTIYTVKTDTTDTQRKIIVNGTEQIQNFTQSVNDGASIYILGSANSQSNSRANFYYFKLYRNDTLIFDGIPVRVGQVGYLYDRVSGQLFGNSGSGSFGLGNDVN